MDQELELLKRQSAARRLERRRQMLEYREKSIRRKRRRKKFIVLALAMIGLFRIGIPVRKQVILGLTVGNVKEIHTDSLLSGQAYSRNQHTHIILISGRIVVADEIDAKSFDKAPFEENS